MLWDELFASHNGLAQECGQDKWPGRRVQGRKRTPMHVGTYTDAHAHAHTHAFALARKHRVDTHDRASSVLPVNKTWSSEPMFLQEHNRSVAEWARARHART